MPNPNPSSCLHVSLSSCISPIIDNTVGGCDCPACGGAGQASVYSDDEPRPVHQRRRTSHLGQFRAKTVTTGGKESAERGGGSKEVLAAGSDAHEDSAVSHPTSTHLPGRTSRAPSKKSVRGENCPVVCQSKEHAAGAFEDAVFEEFSEHKGAYPPFLTHRQTQAHTYLLFFVSLNSY